MRRLFIFFVVIQLFFITSCQKKKGADEQQSSIITEVSVSAEKISVEDIAEKIEMVGDITPYESVDIKSKLAGTIKTITVHEGDKVKQDDILVTLDDKYLSLNVKQQNSQLDSAKELLKQAQNLRELYQADYIRYKNLYEKGAVSKQQLDSIETQLKNAEANVNAAEAQINQINAALHFVKNQFEDLIIRTPITGQIASRRYDPGQNVEPDKAILTVVDISSLWIKFKVDYKNISKIKEGDEVVFKVDSVPDREFKEKVKSVNPAADLSSRAFIVNVLYNNKDRILKAGMFAKGFIQTDYHKNALIIPKEAIILKDEKIFVFVYNNGIAKRIEIKTGITSFDKVEVVSGLSINDLVIVNGQQDLKDGDKVILVK